MPINFSIPNALTISGTLAVGTPVTGMVKVVSGLLTQATPGVDYALPGQGGTGSSISLVTEDSESATLLVPEGYIVDEDSESVTIDF